MEWKGKSKSIVIFCTIPYSWTQYFEAISINMQIYNYTIPLISPFKFCEKFWIYSVTGLLLGSLGWQFTWYHLHHKPVTVNPQLQFNIILLAITFHTLFQLDFKFLSLIHKTAILRIIKVDDCTGFEFFFNIFTFY